MGVIYTYNNLYRSSIKPRYYKKYGYKYDTKLIRFIIKEDIETYENWEYVKYRMDINISELKNEIEEKQYLILQI